MSVQAGRYQLKQEACPQRREHHPGTRDRANVAILLLISRLEAWSHAGMCFVLAAVCLVTLLCTYAFVPETKGVSLEQMDALFDDVSASTAVGCPGLAGGAKVVGARALNELKWWREMLQREACQRGLPLAYRHTFPDASADGVLAPYSDASRELTSMSALASGNVWR